MPTSDPKPRAAIVRRLGLPALFCAGAVLAAPAAKGQALICTAPVEPACITTDLALSDELEVGRCQEDLDSYVEEARTYSACLKEAADEAEASIDRVIEAFRCKTGKGGEAC